MQHPCRRQLSVVCHGIVLDIRFGIHAEETRRHDAILGVGISAVDQHGDTHRFHDGTRFIRGAKDPGSGVLRGRVRKIVGVKRGPVSRRQNVTVFGSDYDSGSIGSTQAAAMLGELLKHVPLQIAIDGQLYFATVNRLRHHLGGTGQSDSVSTALVHRYPVGGG